MTFFGLTQTFGKIKYYYLRFLEIVFLIGLFLLDIFKAFAVSALTAFLISTVFQFMLKTSTNIIFNILFVLLFVFNFIKYTAKTYFDIN